MCFLAFGSIATATGFSGTALASPNKAGQHTFLHTIVIIRLNITLRLPFALLLNIRKSRELNKIIPKREVVNAPQPSWPCAREARADQTLLLLFSFIFFFLFIF